MTRRSGALASDPDPSPHATATRARRPSRVPRRARDEVRRPPQVGLVIGVSARAGGRAWRSTIERALSEVVRSRGGRPPWLVVAGPVSHVDAPTTGPAGGEGVPAEALTARPRGGVPGPRPFR